jgi:hypothetical protein
MGAFEKYMKDISFIRGSIINETIALERMIDIYLSNHFSNTPDKAIELRDWVITDRIIFENKIQILRLVIDKHNIDFKKQNPTYFNDLIFIGEQRNIFAHYLIINDKESIELFNSTGDISFAKFKKDSQIIFHRH